MPEAALTRKGIRDGVAAKLTAAGLVPAGHVLGFRTTPLPRSKLPALLVYVNGQTDRNLSIGRPFFRRSLEIAVEAVIDGASDDGLGDTLDDLCAGIETALLTDPDWIRQFERIGDPRTDLTAVVDGERRMAAAKIVIPVEYVAEYAPNLAAAVDLSTVAVEVDTMEPDGSIEATATWDLP